MPVRTLLDAEGRSLSALVYDNSLGWLRTVTTGTVLSLGSATGFTLTTLSTSPDLYVRLGSTSAVAADGGDGCDIIPPGVKWSQGCDPGSYIALASSTGGAVTFALKPGLHA